MQFDDATISAAPFPWTVTAGGSVPCGAQRRPGSSFCAEHHALSRLPRASRDERCEIALEEALARAVGGRFGPETREPPLALLRRLDRISRLFFYPQSSRYVHSG